MRLAALVAGLLLVAASAVADPRDLTARIEVLGNPAARSYADDALAFARNPWSLKAFEGRLYIGLGNSDNDDPAPNAGPVDIWYFAPESGEFVKEGTADDEQISGFRVIGGRLVIPGDDPREDWSLGNFYRRGETGWEKVRTLPNGIHTFDMIEFGGRIWAALGTQSGAVVAASEDDGRTWREHRLRPNIGGYPSRARSFFVIDDRLHVSTTGRARSAVYRLDGDAFVPDHETDWFPAEEERRWFVPERSRSFRGQAVYVGALKFAGDHDKPQPLFIATSAKKVRRVALPEGFSARDIAVSGERLFVLTTRGTEESRVLETADLDEWRERFRFRTPAFSRSFEVVGDDFYFGLGSDPDDVREETGTILRIRD